MTREHRSEAIATERKSRRDTDLSKASRDRLALPTEFTQSGGIADPAQWQMRWINDDGNRLYNMTKHDDYDVVNVMNPESKAEEAYCRPVGTKPNGEPMYAYLCRKPKDLFQQHQKQNSELAKQKLQTAVRQVPVNEATGSEQDKLYVPSTNTTGQQSVKPYSP